MTTRKDILNSMPLPTFQKEGGGSVERVSSIKRRISHITGFPMSRIDLVEFTLRPSTIFDGKVCTEAAFVVLGIGYSTDFIEFDFEPSYNKKKW